MEKRAKNRFLYFLILSLWILFIFSNSLRPGDASNAQSTEVTGSLNDLLALFGGSFSLSSALVRALAHVGEFFVLGALLSVSAPVFQRYSASYLLCTSLIGIGAALLDESIQYFVPGRSMSPADIVLDTVGSALGFWLLTTILLFWKRKQKL